MQSEFDQALDVLRTGLGSKPGPIASGRIHIAQAEIFASKGDWVRLFLYLVKCVSKKNE